MIEILKTEIVTYEWLDKPLECLTEMIVEVEGIRFRVSKSLLAPGDSYVAPASGQRQTPFETRDWQLLSCERVVTFDCPYGDYTGGTPCANHRCRHPNGEHPDYIVPKEMAYCYDACEVWKVEEML